MNQTEHDRWVGKLGDPAMNWKNWQNIELAEGVEINDYTLLHATGRSKITVGPETIIGPFVYMNAGDHRWGEAGRLIKHQGHECEDIEVGSDCWIGAGCIILRGAKIPDGCVLAAGSVVTRHDRLESFSAYAAAPQTAASVRLRKIGFRDG